MVLRETLRSVERLLEEAVAHASHAAFASDPAHGQAEAARAAHAANNARQLIVFLIEQEAKE